jgi:flavodoxin
LYIIQELVGQKKIAEAIRQSLDGDIDEVHDSKSRKGFMGWLSSGKDAGSKSLTLIQHVDKDPSNYDLVVIGSPTWNGTVSTPIRTYLLEYKEKLQNVALFSTGDGEGAEVINEMNSLIGGTSIAELYVVRKDEVETGEYIEKLDFFLNKIQSFTG